MPSILSLRGCGGSIISVDIGGNEVVLSDVVDDTEVVVNVFDVEVDAFDVVLVVALVVVVDAFDVVLIVAFVVVVDVFDVVLVVAFVVVVDVFDVIVVVVAVLVVVSYLTCYNNYLIHLYKYRKLLQIVKNQSC